MLTESFFLLIISTEEKKKARIVYEKDRRRRESFSFVLENSFLFLKKEKNFIFFCVALV